MIQWGSIEIIDSGNSVGYPVSPMFPLNLDSSFASQVKGRTGVQVGSKQTLSQTDLDKLGPRHRGTWNGSVGGRSVVVRVWETDAG